MHEDREKDVAIASAPSAGATIMATRPCDCIGKTKTTEDAAVSQSLACARPILYERPMFLAMSGIIGVGKTTLADGLAIKFGCDVYHEIGPQENILAAYYANMKEYAFSLQIHLLEKRLSQHQQIIYGENDAIIDRSPYEDSAFAYYLHTLGYISAIQYEIYRKIAWKLHSNMRAPTAILHLDVEPKVALERIKHRGRPYERCITLEFLEGLCSAYEILLSQMAREMPVIRIEWADFVDVKTVATRIKAELAAQNMTKKIKIV
jgi:deoxyadenosine/deoxycytidine kinase